jgi:hypothetical protein
VAAGATVGAGKAQLMNHLLNGPIRGFRIEGATIVPKSATQEFLALLDYVHDRVSGQLKGLGDGE